MIRETLQILIDRYGPSLVQDVTRVETLLKHRHPDLDHTAVVHACRLGLLPGLLEAGMPSGSDHQGKVLNYCSKLLADCGRVGQAQATQAIQEWLAVCSFPVLQANPTLVVATPQSRWEALLEGLPTGGTIQLEAGRYRGGLKLPVACWRFEAKGPVEWELAPGEYAFTLNGGWLEVVGVQFHGNLAEINKGWLWAESCSCRSENHRSPSVYLGGVGSFGSIQGCELAGSGETSVSVNLGACLVATNLAAKQHEDSLLWLKESCATLDGSSFTGPSSTGVAVFGGWLSLKQCVIDGAEEGLSGFEPNSSLHLEDCQILNSQGLGVSLIQGARMQAKSCRFERNGESGIGLRGGAVAQLDDCQLILNGRFGVEGQAGCRVNTQQCVFSANASGDQDLSSLFD